MQPNSSCYTSRQENMCQDYENPTELPAHWHCMATEPFHFYRHSKRGGKIPKAQYVAEIKKKKKINIALPVMTKGDDAQRINSKAIIKGKQCKIRYWWHQMWLWSIKVWLGSHQQYGVFVQLLSHVMRTSAHAAPNGLQYDSPYCFQLAFSFLCLVTSHSMSMPGSCNIITWMFPEQKHTINRTMLQCACTVTIS